MKGEIYYWIALIVVIFAVALYLRYYYSPAINVTVKFAPSSQNQTYYIGQRAAFNITVINNGAAIRYFNIGLYIDGNLTTVYNVSLGQGKQTVLEEVYSFPTSGPYNFTAIGDPAKLYNVADRDNARSSINLNVLAPVQADPQGLLPENQTYTYLANRTVLGYEVSSYLGSSYGMPIFNLSDISRVNSFFTPLLGITTSYITNMSSAGADYSNSKAFSLWISGQLSPSILTPAAQALSLNESNMSIDGNNVTMVLMNNTSICGWYSQGWLKLFSYESNASTCSKVLQTELSSQPGNPIQNNVPHLNGTTEIGSFASYTKNMQSSGRLFFAGNTSFIYSSISTNAIENTTCYGVIDTFNGISYCSTYILPSTTAASNSSLLRTTAYVGNENESVFSLINTSKLESQVGINIGVLKTFRLNGTSVQFVSGLRNTCTLSVGFYCLNANFGDSDVYLNLTNSLNVTPTIRSAYCYWNGSPKVIQIDKLVNVSQIVNLTIPCYNNGANITGIALNLDLNIGLVYTANNQTYNATGEAYIIT